jgi:NTP pyrophosphatase (non-canonical NTP hydrolase)
MYYLYHIPGKKIGVTCNLNKRVTLTQGYNPDEYEVLDQSEDINYISEKEIELQKSYGYKIDRKKYNELIKSNTKMKINVTEQTTTFPFPVKKLKGHLMENIGMQWKTEHGMFKLNIDSIRWIERNVKTSFYNDGRSFIYNKAFAEWFKAPELWGDDLPETPVVKCSKKPLKMFELIREWAQTRGLYDKGNSHTQYVKLQEEAGELAKALLNNDKPEVIDAIGDMVVVLTNLAKLRGYNIEDCIGSAYDVIKSRQGKMINGTFVKETL